MKLKEKLALRAAEKLAKRMKKEDLLVPLKEEIQRLGLTGSGSVDAAMERIEKSGLKKIFDQKGVTRKDIEGAFGQEEVMDSKFDEEICKRCGNHIDECTCIKKEV